MKILIVEPEKVPYTKTINGTLKEMQNIVGGTIQVLYPFPEEVALVCNDEGKLTGLPANRGLFDESGELYDIICGTFFICGAPAYIDNFTSLTQEQSEQFQKRFNSPEMFVRMGNKLLCLPMKG